MFILCRCHTIHTLYNLIFFIQYFFPIFEIHPFLHAEREHELTWWRPTTMITHIFEFIIKFMCKLFVFFFAFRCKETANYGKHLLPSDVKKRCVFIIWLNISFDVWFDIIRLNRNIFFFSLFWINTEYDQEKTSYK